MGALAMTADASRGEIPWKWQSPIRFNAKVRRESCSRQNNRNIQKNGLIYDNIEKMQRFVCHQDRLCSIFAR